jgi:hypothetical protein
MTHRTVGTSLVTAAVFLSALFLMPGKLFAHCDGLDGPVVKAAQKALDTGNVALVLVWVQEKDEREIRAAFQKTLAVRKLNAEARSLADLYFFETLVRIHRAGEGAPYTGLKPAGRDLGPAIPAADKAIETGSSEALLQLLTTTTATGIREQFEAVRRAKMAAKEGDVAAGRKYVEAYVPFIHYVERLYEAAKNPAHGHFEETDGAKGGR